MTHTPHTHFLTPTNAAWILVGLFALALFLPETAWCSTLTEAVSGAQKFTVETIGPYASAAVGIWIMIVNGYKGNMGGLIIGLMILVLGAIFVTMINTKGLSFATFG